MVGEELSVKDAINQYYGFSKTPFSIAPDPNLLYWSHFHRDALANLEHSIANGSGLVLFSGEVGTGKTTIIRRLISEANHSVQYAVILNPLLNEEELMVEICRELAIDVPESGEATLKSRCFNALRDHLIENFSQQRRTVLIIDEAQHLSFSALEQLRLLTNIETDEQKLLLIVFVGQPELRQLIQQPRLRQLAQRITYRPHLAALDAQQTKEYVYCRLQHVGVAEPSNIIPKSLLPTIHKLSGGVPRAINSLVERALIVAYGEGHRSIKRTDLLQAEVDVSSWDTEPVKVSSRFIWLRYLLIILGLFVIVVGGVFVWHNLSAGTLSKSHAVEWVQRTTGVYRGESRCELITQSPRCDALYLTPSELFSFPVPIAVEKNDGSYLVLADAHGESRRLAGPDVIRSVTREDIVDQLSGKFILVWFNDGIRQFPINFDSSAADVTKLAGHFASIDQQSIQLSDGVFSDSLRARVELFQLSHKLTVTGEVDALTYFFILQALED